PILVHPELRKKNEGECPNGAGFRARNKPLNPGLYLRAINLVPQKMNLRRSVATVMMTAHMAPMAAMLPAFFPPLRPGGFTPLFGRGRHWSWGWLGRGCLCPQSTGD